MASYKIIGVDDSPEVRDSDGRGVVTVAVTFDDKSVKTKRMHADCTDEKSMRVGVEEWLGEYTPMQAAEAARSSVDVKAVVAAKPVTVK